jgi:ankyrin repeat protein
LEIKDKEGNTPLNMACFDQNTWNKQPIIAKFLIEKGANVNTRNNNGITPMLGICSGSGPDFDIVRQLIEKSADINGKDNNGRVPLLGVVITGNYGVTKFMIDHNADVNAYDSTYSSNVLDLAISFNTNDSIAKLLIENGAKLNQKDPDGNTELHLAAMRGFPDLIQVLVKKGADVNILNKNNHPALYYAAKHGYRLSAQALIAAGANKNSGADSNYGKASQLTEKLKQGEAYLWYINGGNVIKTKNHLLLLNPQTFDESLEAGLANGRINPSELEDQKIIFFTNYPERARGKLRVITMAARMPENDWVFTTSKLNADTLDIKSYQIIGLSDNLSVGDVKISTLPGIYGGAEFVAFFIEVDGIKIFYGRDHVCTNNVSEVKQYQKEIDSLKPHGPIDMAFLRVRGHFPNDYEPYLYLIDQLSPKAIYLTGGEGTVSEYLKCAKFLQTRNIPVLYPEGRIQGDRFHYLLK